MTVGFFEFCKMLCGNVPLAVTVLLILGVVFVNGWTDAPNAIATCVSTRSMDVRAAIAMAALCNFIGALIMTAVNSTVAQTVFEMTDFNGDSGLALTALCAAMTAVVIWAVAAWAFGIPTSESHALIAGISGAAVALEGSFSAINASQWVKVVYGLVLSTVLGFVSGIIFARSVKKLFGGFERSRADNFFKKMQIAGGAAMALMHGAQDGQKFMGVFMLGVSLACSEQRDSFVVPVWLMLLCSLVMALGTCVGGRKIIKSVGMDMVRLEKYQGFSADTAGAFCLLVSTLFGLPVSTTHTKTTAVMGVGAANRLRSVNWSVAKEMTVAWTLTFPGCGLVGWLTSLIFIKLFRG